MVDIFRIQAEWSGFTGAPAVNTFYTGAAPDDVDAYVDFYDAIKAGIPEEVTITIPATGNIQDEESGAVTGVWDGATTGVVNCTGGGDYAAGVGVVIRWRTSDFSTGRRLQGRSFIVPVVGAVFDVDGSLDASYAETLRAAAADLVDTIGAPLGVWHRPVNEAGGNLVSISSVSVPGDVAILRSRRR